MPAKSKTLYTALPSLPAASITRDFFSLAVAPFGCIFTEYNGMADYENGNWVIKITHNPATNALGVNGNSPAAHTWHRYDGGIGVALGGMTGATEQDFGPDSVTMAGLEHLCAAMAAFALKYDLDSSGTVTSEITHIGDVEASILPESLCCSRTPRLQPSRVSCRLTSDPDCRWDFDRFQPLSSRRVAHDGNGKNLRRGVATGTHLNKQALEGKAAS